MPAVTTPQTSSRLEKAIERARAAQSAGTTFTTSVSLDAAVAVAALLVADKERRDFSNLIDVALAEYVGDAALLPADLAELVEKLSSALRDNPALRPQLDALLRTSKRQRRARSVPAPASVAA